MKIIFFLIGMFSLSVLAGQDFTSDRENLMQKDSLLKIISKDSIDYDAYQNLLNWYMKYDLDSAIFLIKEGLPKNGGEVLFSFFVNPAFYPYDDAEYLDAISFADSVISQKISPEDDSLCYLLRHMYLDDQKYRQKMSELIINLSDSLVRQQFFKISDLMRKKDIRNSALLDSLLNIYKSKLFSCSCDIAGKRAILFVILHSDLKPEFQYKIVTKYKKEVIKTYGAQEYAFLYDRYMINMGNQPVYYFYNPDNVPIDNVKKVNRKRKSIGIDIIK
jgi:hypothetical protein